jgi:hypothetical protein
MVRLAVILGLIVVSLLWRWQSRPANEPTAMASPLDVRAAESEAFARELFRAYAGREPTSRRELERAELLVPRPPFAPTPDSVAAGD